MNASARRTSGGAPSRPKRPALRVLRTEGDEQDIQKIISAELHRLRSLFREIVRNYAARVEGEIAQIREVVEEQREEKGGEEAIQAMRTSIRKLKVKLEKGRRKDLQRIHDLIREMGRWAGAR
jgi:DNA gyrase/topoisomerase IV subunit A